VLAVAASWRFGLMVTQGEAFVGRALSFWSRYFFAFLACRFSFSVF
jgi:hypothetical protein